MKTNSRSSIPQNYFTVFTPTYNRAHLLDRVYRSLCAQTFNDFEWLIIDDGSTDGTGELVKGWRAENHFSIRYCLQENQGKHIAWNRAVDLARGRYFLCADSDDAFVPESLERFRNCLESIPKLEYDKFYGVTALCMTPSGQLIGSGFPPGLKESDFPRLYFEQKVKGEQWYCGKTEIHRKIRFKETFRGSYLPESTIWLKIGKNYKVKMLHKALRIYFDESDSICNTFDYAKNSPGMNDWSKLVLNDFSQYLSRAFRLFLWYAMSYSRSCFHLGIPPARQVRDLINSRVRILWAIVLPKAYMLYIYDRYRMHKKVVEKTPVKRSQYQKP